ncbi:unnamed protein product [Oikopleura dioica]|nr:unnamed protein product [Oikopleura dioica]
MKSDQKLRVAPPVPRPRSTTFSLVAFQRVTEEIRMQCEEKREASERAARGECEQALRMIEKKNRRMKKFENAFANGFIFLKIINSWLLLRRF